MPRTNPIRWTREHIRQNGFFWQFFKYGIVGGIAFVADFSIFLGLTRLAHLHPSVANVISSLVGMLIIFVVNRKVTFKAVEGDVRAQTRRFVIVSIVNYALQQGLLWLFLHWALLEVLGPWHDVGAKVLAIGLIVLSNFLGHRLWTFWPSSPASSDHALPPLPPRDV